MGVTLICVGRLPPGTRAPEVADNRAAGRVPSLGSVEGLGLEGLAALLTSETARQNGKLMRELQRDAKQSQVEAIQRQVEHLHEKASDIASEALVAGSIAAVSGALTIASAAAMPSTSDAAKGAQWENAGKRYGHGFEVVSAQAKASLEAQKAASQALATGGQTVNGLSGAIAKGTYGAQQVMDDAEATRAASDAKFAEAARDEYAALGRDFDAGSGKALQILQQIATDRQTVRRGLLQRA